MKKFKWMIALIVVLLLTAMFSMTAFATNTGNVAGAVEGTWKAASSQIKTVVNNVVFPAIDLVLAGLFFVQEGTVYCVPSSGCHFVCRVGFQSVRANVCVADCWNLRSEIRFFWNKNTGGR